MSSYKEHKTLLLLCALNFFVGSNYWVALFMSATLPGQKSTAGLSYGCAEFLGSIVAGYLLRIVKDTTLNNASMICIVFAQSLFYFGCGGAFNSTLSLFCYFVSVLGIGISFCCIFYMIERRVPADKLGNAFNKAFSCFSVGAIAATFVSYLPQPAPYLTIACGSVISIVLLR